MSRSGYSEDYGCGDNRLYLYRANVDRALAGRRGQAFLKDLLAQLDAMPEKRLTTGELEENGEVCTLGVITRARGIDTSKLKFGERNEYGEGEDDDFVIAQLVEDLDISAPMVREIMYENDDYWLAETPEKRWQRMRRWVEGKIRP